ncbi:hypothetical protein [Endothiovibrio diazotrophicus]
MKSSIRDETTTETTNDETYTRLWHVSAQFVHDIRTPLLCNLAGGSVAQRHWSGLREAYELAVEHGLVERQLSPRLLDDLGGVIDDLVKETEVGRALVERYWKEVQNTLPIPEQPWKGNGGLAFREIRGELEGR